MTQSKGNNWVLIRRLNRIIQGLNWCKGEAKRCYFFFLLLNVFAAGVTKYRSFVRALERTLLVTQLLGCKQSVYRDGALLRVDPTRTRTDSEPRHGKTGNVPRILLKYIVYLFLCLLKFSVFTSTTFRNCFTWVTEQKRTRTWDQGHLSWLVFKLTRAQLANSNPVSY